jgi:hypothetical protein
MPKIVRVWLRRLSVVAVAVALIWGVRSLARGCGKRTADQAYLTQLRITRRLLHAHMTRDTARVLAEIANTGDKRTPECRLRARIWSRGGTQRGSGTTGVPALDPGEKCILGMRVPVHERTRTSEVSFEFLPPG